MPQIDIPMLIERIKQDPSVLFLGQHYLSSYSGRDPFYDVINQTICGSKMPSTPSYANIWEYANGGNALTENSFSQLFSVTNKLPTQWWLRKILSMRWGMVFTSAVDACLTHCVGPNFTFNPVEQDKKRFRREYMNKRMLHGVYLYGSVSGSLSPSEHPVYPPEKCDNKTLRSLKKNVNDRISWIYNDILRDYGVLVIDGWDPQQDWLSFLLDNAGGMPYDSIYLFGATSQMEADEVIRGLVEDGIMTLCPQTFAQALDEHGFFADSEDLVFPESSSSFEACKTVTIRGKHGRDSYLSIPLSALDALDSRITLMDDDLGNRIFRLDDDTRSNSFARFLQQGNVPNWPLCTVQAGFHFAREVDDELWKRVDEYLKKRASRRGILALEGVSNSGKTTALVHLAMRLRDEHQCPVVYISGIPTQSNFEDLLKNFIKQYFLGRQDGDGAWVDNVIILWDGNVDAGAIRRYEHLAQTLTECNALVVGTVYRHENADPFRKNGIDYIHVNAVLTAEERKSLGSLLSSVDTDLFDRFQEVTANQRDNLNLFYILQSLSKFRYSPEWKNVKMFLERQFYLEVDRTESNSRQAIEEFNKRLNEEAVNSAILERGIAAAWQLKLEIYLEQLKEQGQYDPAEKDIATAAQDDKARKLLALREDIRLVNATLAMAGQFSIPLPVTLLLSMLSHNGATLSQENLFVNDVLANDSLVEYYRDEEGYPIVRFRHPSEAEQYIAKNFGEDPQERKAKEVDLLCKIIAACHWDEDESYDVIALVRCFGPNSAGKYSQNPPHGRYGDYLDFFPEITDCLEDYAYDNPEATLVYAHFLREKYNDDQEYGRSGSEDYLRRAAAELRQAIDNHDQHNRQQYNRLIVEVCSNLVSSMPRSRCDGIFSREVFRELKNHFNTAIRTWVDDSRNSNFTTNSLLDIWLNAVCNFYRSFENEGQALADQDFAQALSDSLYYIDTLFSIQDDFSSTNLLSKIDDIYNWASSDDMEKISQRLASQGNDTFLYLTARRCWLNGTPVSNKKSPEEIIRHNLFFLPDAPDSQQNVHNILEELRPMAIRAADQAITVLEKDMDLIRRSKSSRCLHMLIRAKWLSYTGKLLLEEKQTPALTRDQWRELYELCSEYARFCTVENTLPKPAIMLLRAIYLWAFTPEISEARAIFTLLRQQMGNNTWYIERIGLCSLGTSQLRTFYVDIQRAPSGAYTARISSENTAGNQETPFFSLNDRYGIHVSERVLGYLFDGQEATQRFNISKPVVLWFTTAGPTLGFPSPERGVERQ